MASTSQTARRDLIPKAVRVAFRNLCSGIYLGAIDDMFEMDGFQPDRDYQPSVQGDRRTLAEQYHVTIDWHDASAVRRVLRVYSRALGDWGHDHDGEWGHDAHRLVRELRAHHFTVAEDGLITAPSGILQGSVDLADYRRLADQSVVEQYLSRMDEAVRTDPDEAIGNAKELVESVCKLVLEDAGAELSKSHDLAALYKATAKELRLETDSVPDSVKGSAAAHKVLRSLASTVQGMAELRNELGTGHGKTRRSPATPRHAQLAVGAARTLTVFLLDTWHDRKPA